MNLTKKRWMSAMAVAVTIGMGSTAAFAASAHQTTAKEPTHHALSANASPTATWRGHHDGMGRMHGGMMGGQLAIVAKALNISASTLQSDLKAGKSIASIAQAQGVATSTLISDLEASVQTSLASKVTSGKITSAQEQKMLTRIDQQITNFINGTMPKWNGSKGGTDIGRMHGGMGRMHGGMMGGQLATVAKALNISASTLQSDLKAGKSIASIAQAQGVATSTLISDLEASLQTKLAGMVTNGKITSAQEQKMLTRMDKQITNFVNGTTPKWGNSANSNQQG